MPRLLALLLLLVLLPATAQGQRASIAIDADSLRVGEAFALVVTVQANGRIVPLDSAFAGPNVSLLGPPETTTDVDASGALTTRLAYRASAFALDTLRLPPVTLRVVNSVDTTVLSTAPLALRMQRLVPDDSTAALKPALGPEPFGPPWWLVALVLLALAALAVWFWRRRPKKAAPATARPPETPLTPAQALARTLDALAAAPPPAGDDARPYFDTLTDAFRAYLEARLSVPAREQTSRELVERFDRLERAGTLQPGATALARDLFRVADLARFADVRAGPQTARVAVDQARTLAAYVEKSRERRPERQGVPKPQSARPAPADA